MRVAYAKLGRSVLLDPQKWKTVGGDNESLYLLQTLAESHPDVTWVVAGRHSGDPGNLPPNVEVPELPKIASFKPGEAAKSSAAADLYTTMEEIYGGVDGAVLWLGQHGTSNQPIPQDKNPAEVTNPQDFAYIYGGSIINALNVHGERLHPTWLCADPRNYLKARDLKWYPRSDEPILGQFDFERSQRHYRFDDPRTPDELGRHESSPSPPGNFWRSAHSYVGSGLELVGIPFWEDQQWPGWEERHHFGIIINEARPYVNPRKKRSNIVRDWVNPLNPAFIHGKWTVDGLRVIGRESVEPIHYLEMAPVLATAKSTFTTPSSGSEWATAKWWECAALGVVCFMHPYYDTQGHILPRTPEEEANGDVAALVQWLRPKTPRDLALRVQAVNESRETYQWLAEVQRRVLMHARHNDRCVTEIERRLGLKL